MSEERFKAVVIRVDGPRTKDLRNLIRIAGSVAQVREKSNENFSIRALKYIPELNCYVAIYALARKTSSKKRGRKG